MDLQDLQAFNEKRRAIRPLLSPSDPGDALTSYYALWHDPRRTSLVLHYDEKQRPDGFIAVCQTGADLFRPLVTFRAPDEATATTLLHTALAVLFAVYNLSNSRFGYVRRQHRVHWLKFQFLPHVNQWS